MMPYICIMEKESKRQKQMGETVKRHFSTVLQQQGGNIYGFEVLVTITEVKMTPDLGLAKIYFSIFNTENKQETLLLLQQAQQDLRQALSQRLKKHARRVPHIDFYIDETLDEMYRVDTLFNKLEEDNQMGEKE